jgi:hypothetical protein
MPLEFSDFELAMLIAPFAGLFALCLCIVVAFEMRERRSPVGRLMSRRWFGV